MNAECKVENLHCTCFYEGNNLTSIPVFLSLNQQYSTLIVMFKSSKKKLFICIDDISI